MPDPTSRRVASIVGLAAGDAVGTLRATSEAEALELARLTALPTHDHERGISGAQAVVLATWLAAQGAEPEEIRRRVAAMSGYDMDRTVEQIRPDYRFQVSCDLSVPEAIICALEADSWESAVRLAVWLGGDADTQAAIAGGIMTNEYMVAWDPWDRVRDYLPEQMRSVVRTMTRWQH